jgi:hypothetical protein
MGWSGIKSVAQFKFRSLSVISEIFSEASKVPDAKSNTSIPLVSNKRNFDGPYGGFLY